MLGKKDHSYYIMTANKVHIEDVDNLVFAINQVNDATKEELKEMYKIQLKEGSISERGGAGLGLIDIARKTGNKLFRILGFIFIFAIEGFNSSLTHKFLNIRKK